MLKKLDFKNFYSFKNKVSLDFVSRKNKKLGDSYYIDGFGNSVSKVVVAIGANASGKTNLLRSVAFLKWFISDSFVGLAPNEDISYKPFLFSSKNYPTEFLVEFDDNNHNEVFRYQLIITQKRVVKEMLSSRAPGKRKFVKLFKRESRNGKDTLSFGRHFSLPNDFSSLLKDNSSVISTAKQIGNSKCENVCAIWRRVNTNVVEEGRIWVAKEPDVAEFYLSNTKIKNKMEEFIRHFDLGLSGVEIKKVSVGNETRYDFYGKHKMVDNYKAPHFELPFKYESSGTRNLIMWLKTIFKVLENGGVALLDELDVDLHPHIVMELIKIFSSKKHNPLNAQLFTSLHAVEALRLLDKQQIVIVEKNDLGESNAWSLADLKGVRSDENIYSKYMAGVYGGIPKL